MAKTPIVLIHSGAGASLDRLYRSIKDNLNERYHKPGNSFTTYTMSEAEIAEQAALSSHAAHASHGYELVDDTHVRCPDGSVVHIERLVW